MPPYVTYTSYGPEYLHSLPAPQYTWCPLHPPDAPYGPTPLHHRRPQMLPYATYTHSSPWVPTLPASPQYTPTPLHPLMLPMPPNSPWHPLEVPLMPPIPLLVFNCCHFATDHLCAFKMLIFYHCHLQLLLLCNWPSSWVHPVYKIPSLGVKNTSSVLWRSANFCSISQIMHYKDPVASQHWKTNKVVWTWKDDWPSWRTSTYKRPFTQEGNYLVELCVINIFFLLPWILV